MSDSIVAHYIDKEKAEVISQELRKWYLENKHSIKTRDEFIQKTNEQLYSSSNDLHLKLYENLNEDDSESEYEEEATKIYTSKSNKSKAIIDSGEKIIDYDLKSGISDARILDNNIGYLALYWIAEDPDQDKAIIDDVMLKMKDTKALIIDIGVNIGGAPFGVRYYSGYLFQNKTHLSSFKMRSKSLINRERWSIETDIPLDSYFDKPIYILTSKKTFSAAESFVFGLKNNDRITQIGEGTAGGGFFGGTYVVSEDPLLELWVSRGMTYNPKNGNSWEAKGIQPDIQIDYSAALEKAIQEINQKY
ncbi:S41 family peptidase [Muricauda sp. 2012CJ35-5]|uniref:S41 family peptidase n=1 Tax=Flagellimonas spongiicola TaxID=2942208 RepID=A0ABT0PSX3_9FLAO|nr:S41 family peptidase [Allomuricauda spongiicola]MCL6274487.1 S41 family peptidase [Allomuricauda spongiicola]